MPVHILLSCIGDVLPTKLSEWQDQHRALHQEICKNAVTAWQNRVGCCKTVRFMQKLPSSSGLHFRFLNVSEKSGKLFVSRT